MPVKYPHLFTPITLGNTTFRNRIFASPTGAPSVSPPEYLKAECRAFYELRSKGGAAAVSTGDGIVHTETGLMHPYKLRLDDPAVIPSISNMARGVRQYGAVPSLELSHGGKYANVANLVSKNTRTGAPAYGPDHEFTEDGAEILEMPEEIILRIVEAYGAAARLAKNCGFGMVTVHAGHGWLLNQFLSPATNHRRDAYGGSRENRARFTLMALDSIRRAVGPGFPIELRMSGAEFTRSGYDIDEGVELAKLLAPKVDLVHVSAGVHDDADTTVITHPSMFREHGCNVWLAERIRNAIDTPVTTIGGLNDPAMMEEIIASGKADLVSMSRALTADPELPNKARRGEDEKIVKCIRCFLCLNQTATTRNIRCSVNPEIGRELEHRTALPKVEKPKRVLVVGGGPGGLRAALTAAERGHRVTLCEAGERLGGQLLCEEFVPFKKELFDYSQQLARRATEAGVDILTDTRVTGAWAESFAPDALICAIGAEHIVPPIPGIDGSNVRFLPELRKRQPDFGMRVVILGGGLVGCETAVHLREQGHEVSVVELRGDFAPDATIWHRQALSIKFRDGVKLYLNSSATAITPEGVVVKSADGTESLVPGDTVFCAVGLRSRAALREELRFVTPDFYAIGDCVKPGQVFGVTAEAHFTARELI